jgi:serine/threonine-protein kinase RsbW
MKATTVHLRIQSQTGQLHLVREFVSSAAREFGFDEESAGKIILAVDEACTNIIKHSYENSPSNDIDVEVTTNGRRFEVIMTHKGKSFNPESVKTPDMKEYFKQFQRGGLGIHLMRSLMDAVEYKTLPDHSNQILLAKNLPSEKGE